MNEGAAASSNRAVKNPSRRVRLRWIACLLLLVPSLPSRANGPASDAPAAQAGARSCAEQAAEAVQRHYESVNDIEARFEQTTRSVALGSGSAAGQQVTRGRVLFAKPGRMRWHYESPAESLVVSDGSTLWIYDPAAGEAQHMDVTDGYLSGAALHFLLGDGRLDEEFTIRTSDDCAGDAVELVLTPRKEAAYERLTLTVRPDSGEMLATSVRDLFGNETVIRFRDVRTNTAPAPERFRFEPPDGVRVLDVAGPHA